MTEDKLIQAYERICANCSKNGWRWIHADIDIKPFVLCEEHALKFQRKILSIMRKRI